MIRLIRLFCLQIHGVLRKDIPAQNMNIGLTMIRFNYRNNVLQKAQTSFFLISKRLVLLYWNIKKRQKSNWILSLTPRVGFEPTTLRLTAECSTTELSRNIKHWSIPSKLHTKNHPFPITLLGYALDLLVTVSSMRYRTSTSALSTSSSSRGLTNLTLWDISSWGGLHA